MVDPRELPYLLALVDDESLHVRDSVLAKLAEFGHELDEQLARLPEPPSPQLRSQLHELLADYRARIKDFAKGIAVGSTIGKALFSPGQLVKHRRYGYRGVVAAYDTKCMATAAWYGRNRSQPERQQPWYHVLVHESDATTYAAQASLLADPSDEEVRHPLLMHFFSAFEDGVYLRNETEWPREP